MTARQRAGLQGEPKGPPCLAAHDMEMSGPRQAHSTGDDGRLAVVVSRADPPTDATRRRMKAVRQTKTGAEMAVRRELFRRGLRFRVDLAPIPGIRSRADVVFTRRRLAIFVDGCFWHRCPLHRSEPMSNADWWRAKLDANEARDRRTDASLEQAGWRVLRAWEHEPAIDVVDRIEQMLDRDVGDPA